MCVRGLLRDERTDFAGEFFTLTDAQCEPKPLQTPLADLGRRRRREGDAAPRGAVRRRLERAVHRTRRVGAQVGRARRALRAARPRSRDDRTGAQRRHGVQRRRVAHAVRSARRLRAAGRAHRQRRRDGRPRRRLRGRRRRLGDPRDARAVRSRRPRALRERECCLRCAEARATSSRASDRRAGRRSCR